jgi:hypothetical protein
LGFPKKTDAETKISAQQLLGDVPRKHWWGIEEVRRKPIKGVS